MGKLGAIRGICSCTNLQFPKKPDFHFLNSPLRSTGGERIIFCDAFHSYGLHQIAYLVGFSFFLGQGCFSSVSCPCVSPSFSSATGFAMAGAVRRRVFRRFPVLLCHHPFLRRLDSQWQAPSEDVFFVGFLSFCVTILFFGDWIRNGRRRPRTCFSSVSCPSVSPSFSAATGFAMAGAVRGRVFRRFPVLLCHHLFLRRLDSQWQAPSEDVFFVGFLSFCVTIFFCGDWIRAYPP